MLSPCLHKFVAGELFVKDRGIANDKTVQYIAFEAWERMTYGGAVAQYDTIVPDNLYTEIGGQRVSYPYVAR